MGNVIGAARGVGLRWAVMIGMALVVSVSATTACGGNGYDNDTYHAICVSRTSDVRVDDKDCGNSQGDYSWMYYRPGHYVPAVGSWEVGGMSSVPNGLPVARGVPTDGSNAGEQGGNSNGGEAGDGGNGGGSGGDGAGGAGK